MSKRQVIQVVFGQVTCHVPGRLWVVSIGGQSKIVWLSQTGYAGERRAVSSVLEAEQKSDEGAR
jgi:hypothetical protein